TWSSSADGPRPPPGGSDEPGSGARGGRPVRDADGGNDMRSDISVTEAQREVRTVFRRGSVGQAVSGAVWLASAAAATFVGTGAGMLVLVAGGFFIFPLTRAALHVAGRPSALS